MAIVGGITAGKNKPLASIVWVREMKLDTILRLLQ